MKFLKDNTIVDIMEAKPNDAEELLKFLKTVGSESNYLLLDENGLDATVEQEQEYIRKANASITTKHFLAKTNGKIIGNCGINGSDRKKIKHNVNLGISILKEYWDKGLGTILLEHVVNYARITGKIKNIYLEVREDNLYAIKLYEKIGFKRIAMIPDKLYVNGKYHNELMYMLQIN